MSTSIDSAKPTAQSEANLLPWSPWLAVIFIIAIYFVTQIIGGILVSIYPALHHWSAARTDSWLNNAVSAQFVYVLIVEGMTLWSIYAFLKHYKLGFKAIGLRKPRWSDPGYGLLVLPLYYLTYIIIVAIAGQLVPSLNVNQAQQIGFTGVHSFAPLLFTFISLVVLPPLTEEIMMRGFLYTSLKKGMPQIGAALVTSIIFASGHLQVGSGAPLLWIAALDTFILSLFLIYLREKTHGLWASMTLHALKNGIAFVSLFILHLS